MKKCVKWFFKWVRNKNGLKIFTVNNSNYLLINCRFWKSRIWKFIVNQKNFINSLQGNFMYSIGIQHYRQKLPQYINKTWDEVFPTFMSQFNSSKRGSTWSAKGRRIQQSSQHFLLHFKLVWGPKKNWTVGEIKTLPRTVFWPF